MIPTTIYQDIPRPFPRDDRSNLRQFLQAHQVDLDNRDADLEYIKRSHDITEAVGRDLELIGRRFGTLGQRRGRGDDVYRHYLSGLEGAFSGRGTREDVKYAFASGIFAQQSDNIIITEDVENHEYNLTITDWQKHSTSLIEDYSEFAEPSGVELAFPITYVYEDANITVKGSEAGANPSVQYPPAQITVSGGETTATIVNDDGLGADFFGSGDSLGPGGTSDNTTTTNNVIRPDTTTTVQSVSTITADSPLEIGGELVVAGELRIKELTSDISGVESGSTTGVQRGQTVTVDGRLDHDGELVHNGTLEIG